MKKIGAIILAAALCISMLSACTDSGSNLKKSNANGEKWSVFVYVCGTDLESQSGGMASINIQEMLGASKNDNVKIVFQTGGTSEWGTEGISSETLQRYEVVEDTIELKDEQSLQSMGDADTLGSYLKWGVENYPADKYMCLFWNHGGGSVSGVCFDELFENDSLNLDEISTGLSQAGTEFEVVGFDTCLMSTVETACALAPYANYMVASEELEPGTGWDYTAWLSYLADNSRADGLALGKYICDSYLEKCAKSGDDDMATLAVTDLSQIPSLVSSFDNMALELSQNSEDVQKLGAFATAYSKAENYGGNNDNEGYTNMVDLGDMVSLSNTVLPDSSKKVLENLNNAVKYHVAGASRTRSTGLSLFAPLSTSAEELDKYAQIAFSGNYLRFLESSMEWSVPDNLEIIVPVQSGDSIVTKSMKMSDFGKLNAISSSELAVAFETSVRDNNYYLTFTGGHDAVANIKYNLYYKDDDSNELYYLGSDYDLNADEEKGEYWSNLRNVWPIINDSTCSMIPLSFNENYILYTVPIKLNGTKTNLRMTYDIKSGEYKVHGTWSGIDENGMSAKEVKKLKDGDKITFLFCYTDVETDEQVEFEADTITVNGELKVEEAKLFDSVYYYQYEITDVTGKTYQSDFARIEVKNGKATVIK